MCEYGLNKIDHPPCNCNHYKNGEKKYLFHFIIIIKIVD